MKKHLKSIPSTVLLVLFVFTLLGLTLSSNSCTRIDEEDFSSGQEPTPAMSQNPSPTLVQYMVNYIGEGIQANNIKRYSSNQMAYIGGAEPYMIQSAQNGGNFWLVPIKNNLTPVGIRITYKVDPAFQQFYEGADFVMAATIEDASHPYVIGIRKQNRKVCKNYACANQEVLVDAGAISVADLCTAAGGCSGAGQSNGNSQQKLCMVNNCVGSVCKPTIMYVSALQSCPSGSCNTSADCGNNNKKTCHYKKCSNVGVLDICETVSTEVEQSAPCPNNECSTNSDCDTQGGGGGGTILDALGY